MLVILDRRDDVDGVRAYGLDRIADVLGRETAGEDERAAERRRDVAGERPVDRRPCSGRATARLRVEQDRVGARVDEPARRCEDLLGTWRIAGPDPDRLDDADAGACEAVLDGLHRRLVLV